MISAFGVEHGDISKAIGRAAGVTASQARRGNSVRTLNAGSQKTADALSRSLRASGTDTGAMFSRSPGGVKRTPGFAERVENKLKAKKKARASFERGAVGPTQPRFGARGGFGQ